nr:PREDICTED: HERV-H LTR-associating protein 2 [Lepisosteus oculatus]
MMDWERRMLMPFKLLFFWIFWVLKGTQCEIPSVMLTCGFSQDCVLPCRFRPAGDEVIHWKKDSLHVHSYYHQADQLSNQDLQYNGRTALFKDQLLTLGNASLLLRHIKVQDKGRYQCSISTQMGSNESSVIVKVEAPVRSLDIEFTSMSGFEEVICSSRGIYPAPHIRWFTEPALLEPLKPTTRKTPDGQGLYSVDSRLKKLNIFSNYIYICAVNSLDGKQNWTASLKEQAIAGPEGQELAIPCVTPSKNLKNFILKWSFRSREKSSDILSYDSRSDTVLKQWQDAQVTKDSLLSGDGTLLLLNPKSTAHTGTYTCRYSVFETVLVIHTAVNITMPAGIIGRTEKESNTGVIIGVAISSLIVGALITAIVAVIIYRKRNKGKPTSPKNKQGGKDEEPAGESLQLNRLEE